MGMSIDHLAVAATSLDGRALDDFLGVTLPPGGRHARMFELPAVEVATVRTVDGDDAAELGYRALRGWMTREAHTLQGPKRQMPVPAEPGWLELSFPFRAVAPA